MIGNGLSVLDNLDRHWFVTSVTKDYINWTRREKDDTKEELKKPIKLAVGYLDRTGEICTKSRFIKVKNAISLTKLYHWMFVDPFSAENDVGFSITIKIPINKDIV